jgi:hypothetical protein
MRPTVEAEIVVAGTAGGGAPASCAAGKPLTQPQNPLLQEKDQVGLSPRPRPKYEIVCLLEGIPQGSFAIVEFSFGRGGGEQKTTPRGAASAQLRPPINRNWFADRVNG